ncbi:MAG: serpin family protein [Planctomycetota bacterium]|jgi:serpin B
MSDLRHGEEPIDTDMKALAEAVNAFGWDLYGSFRNAADNAVFSPYSISAALTMALLGARGETAREMMSVLHLPHASAALGYGALTKALEPNLIDVFTEDGPSKVLPFELHVANALWGQEDLAFLAPFLSDLKQQFGAALKRVDFRDSAAARTAINAWVNEQTRGRIKDIMQAPLPSADTLLALASAIYCKAAWAKPFTRPLTKPAAFFTAASEATVEMMCQVDSFPYAELDDAQMLEMPHSGGVTSMLLVLPRDRSGLADLEGKLSGNPTAAWLEALESRQVLVRMPRFEFTCPLDLANTLPAMGLTLAFDRSEADFSGMNEQPLVHLGEVMHKAFLKVDEEGTEAAAATVIDALLRGAPRPEFEFVADHPFLFLILHRATRCILFIGRVCQP